MRPEVNMTALGAHVASARRQQHLRQADLAREVGIHAVTLSRIEHGKLPGVTVAVLARLAMRARPEPGSPGAVAAWATPAPTTRSCPPGHRGDGTDRAGRGSCEA